MAQIKTTVAKGMRKLGMGRLVDSRRFRAGVGAPIYKKHGDPDGPVEPVDTRVLTPTAPLAPPQPPRLTVVVPAYNVAGFLDECVNSILVQTFRAIEIIIVDDGSTDDTGRVADAAAQRDPRIIVVHQDNAGLGAARNVGIKMSKAPYITFVDSDDTIPPNAYRAMMDSLERTGSDVAIGAIERFTDSKRWTPAWVRLVHDEHREGIVASDLPAVMWDVFACNKVFRKEAFLSHVGGFPEGTLYEDQECTAKLYVQNAKLDVLKDTVYSWRLREDGSSITQQKSSASDLAQRLNVARTVRNIVTSAPQHYVDYWYTKCLGDDLYYYYREVPRAGDDFWELLVGGSREFWSEASAEARHSVEPPRRWLAYAAAHLDRVDFERILLTFDERGAFWDVERVGDRLLGTIPELEPIMHKIPEDIREITPESLEGAAILTAWRSGDDGEVEITGHAWVGQYEPGELSISLRLEPADSEEHGLEAGTRPIELPVVRLPGPLPVGTLRDPYHHHEGSSFCVTLRPELIDTLGDPLVTEGMRRKLVVTLSDGHSEWRVEAVRRFTAGSAGAPMASSPTAKGNRVVAVGGTPSGTTLIPLSPRFVARDVALMGNTLTLAITAPWRGKLPGSIEHTISNGLRVRVRRGTHDLAVADAHPDEAGWSATLQLPTTLDKPTKNSEQLTIEVVGRAGYRAPIAASNKQIDRAWRSRFGLSASHYGYLALERVVQHATVEAVKVTDDGEALVCEGSYYIDPVLVRQPTPTFALVGAQEIRHPIQVTLDSSGGRFQVTFPLVDRDYLGRKVGARTTRYIFEVLYAAKTGLPAAQWVTTSRSLEASLASTLSTPWHTVRFEASDTARSLIVKLNSPDFGGKTPATLRDRVNASATTTDRPLRRAVLLESFGGTAITDACLALDREFARTLPDLARYWTVVDRSVAVPAGSTPLLFESEEWFDALSSCQLLVNNNNFPYYFRKRSDQVYAQVWHGTPLKKIGADVPSANLSLRYRALMKREALQWDVLIAQSTWAADVLAKAFGYSGDVLSLGYPRNDALLDPHENAALRDAVRVHFGVSQSQTVVLYAPTWRDDLKDPSGHYSRVDKVGLKALASLLGPDYIVLYRGHTNSANAAQSALPASVIDVTMFPELNALIAASDALITDYSSIMFDYPVTGKPIAFMVPDLARYRDATRGFYFDFESSAPGPLLRKPAEAAAFCESVRHGTHALSERYVKWVARFAPRDDGHAAERITAWLASRAGLSG